MTCVTAIMICLALTLALEMVVSSTSSPAAVTSDQINRTQSAIAELQREIQSYQNRAAIAAEELAGMPTLDEDALRRQADDLEADVKRQQQELEAARARQRAGEQRLADRTNEDNSQSQGAAETLDDFKRQQHELRDKIEALASGDRVFFRPGETDKTMWLVELTEQQFLFARMNVSEPPRSFTKIASPHLEEWLRSLDPTANAFLIVVKPRGESRYLRLRTRLLLPNSNGDRFDVGVQVAPSDQIIIDPKIGAGAP